MTTVDPNPARAAAEVERAARRLAAAGDPRAAQAMLREAIDRSPEKGPARERLVAGLADLLLRAGSADDLLGLLASLRRGRHARPEDDGWGSAYVEADYRVLRHRLDQAAILMETAHRRATTAGDRHGAVRALARAGGFQIGRDDSARGFRTLHRCRTLARATGETDLLPYICLQLASGRIDAGAVPGGYLIEPHERRFLAGLADAVAGLEAAAADDDMGEQVRGWILLSRTEMLVPALSHGLDFLEAGRRAAKRLGDAGPLSIVLDLGVGDLRRQMGAFGRARAAFDRAQARAAQCRFGYGVVRARLGLAALAGEEGDPAAGVAEAETALREARGWDAGPREPWVAASLFSVAEMALAAGDPARARAALDGAAALPDSPVERCLQFRMLQALADGPSPRVLDALTKGLASPPWGYDYNPDLPLRYAALGVAALRKAGAVESARVRGMAAPRLREFMAWLDPAHCGLFFRRPAIRALIDSAPRDLLLPNADRDAPNGFEARARAALDEARRIAQRKRRGPGAAPVEGSLQALERGAVVEALRKAEGRREEAARILGISRVGLWKKMSRLGLLPPDARPGRRAKRDS